MSKDRKPGPVESAWEGWIKSDECGDGPFLTGEHDSFLAACRLHDYEYLGHDTGEESGSRKEVDARFLRRALLIAKNRGSWWMKFKAYLYYGIIRAVGGIAWRRGSTIAGKLYRDGGEAR